MLSSIETFYPALYTAPSCLYSSDVQYIHMLLLCYTLCKPYIFAVVYSFLHKNRKKTVKIKGPGDPAENFKKF
jgi:hypothetical protein